jgi:leucine dehydrogenase
MTALPHRDGELTCVRHDEATGARYVVAVHPTRLGPASAGPPR